MNVYLFERYTGPYFLVVVIASFKLQEVDVSKIPQKHMVNPEFAVKKCSSSLELDSTADSILNINFIDVNCNPGLK